MNTQIYEEATDWIVKNREGCLGAQEKKRFDQWLRQSPEHIRAYLEMSSIWEDVSSLDPSWNAGAEELIARARAQENVIPLEVPRLSTSERENALISNDDAKHRLAFSKETEQSVLTRTLGEVPRRAEKVRLFALAASVLVALAGTWLYIQRNTYSTDIGEQRSIVLNDGSTIELNSRTRVRVRFSDAERDVDLLDGQALFRVAKNPARPFIVHSGSARVRAVGTQFDVYKRTSGTTVTVVEGRVAVTPDPYSASPPLRERVEGPGVRTPLALSGLHERTGSASNSPSPGDRRGAQGGEVLKGDGSAQSEAPIFLTANEQITVSGEGSVAHSRHPNVEAATAWTRRSLVFDSSPLTEVAEEFNRYNTRQLIIEDPQLADFHISGVFSSVDPALLLRFLRTQSELVVEETNGEIRISRK